MGQLGSRHQDDQQTTTAGANGPKVWLESCADCGRPMTVLAVAKPVEPRCADCPAPAAPPDGPDLTRPDST